MAKKNKVICTVSNYNKDEEARLIKASLTCPTFVIDSSGKQKRDFHSTDGPFYSACFNKSCELLMNSDATHMLFVCSDIKGNLQAAVSRIECMPSNIGIYSPAVLGQGWRHEKPQKYGLRDVPFCEGMVMCLIREIVEKIYPVNIKSNPHGFGIDIYMGYISNVMLGKRVVIDDDINVYHPYGTSYDSNQGRQDMLPYLYSKGVYVVKWYNENVVRIGY